MRTTRSIVCFTRPWEILFHQRLARGLRGSVGDGAASITYLTMWGAAADWLEPDLESFEEIVRLPPLLRDASLDVPRLERLANQLETWSGTPLATMVASERYLPEDARSRREFALRHLHVLERVIPEGALLVCMPPDHLCYWLACDLVRWRGGDFFGFSATARPSGRTQVTRNSSQLWLPYEAKPEHLDEAREQRAQIQQGQIPGYMRQKKPRPLWDERLRWRRSLLQDRIQGNYFVTNDSLFSLGRLSDPTRMHRWRRAQKIMEPVAIDALEKPFIYLPLHMEPEAATWVRSPHLRDQAFFIDTVARAAPAGVDIVLKENPKMHGKRTDAFYTRTRRHPSVVWVDPSASSSELVAKSLAVVSLTGTACMESVMMGRPSAIVGQPPYASAFTDIPRITDLEALPTLIQELISGGHQPDPDRVLAQHAHYIANMVPATYLARTRIEGFDCPMIPPSDAFETFVVDALDKAEEAAPAQ